MVVPFTAGVHETQCKGQGEIAWYVYARTQERIAAVYVDKEHSSTKAH